MNLKCISHTFVSFVFSCAVGASFISNAYALETEGDEEKENRCQQSQMASESPRKKRKIESGQLPECIRNIKQQIQKAFNEGDANGIIDTAYTAFSGCVYGEEEWEKIAHALKAKKWPSQSTWRETVGGELFFPSEIFDWERSDTEDYRLERKDTLYALAVSAKFKHPCALYFLATTLDIIHSNHTDAPKPSFFSDLYKQVWPALEDSADHPDACYVMGRSLSSSKSSLNNGRFNPAESLKWHSRGKDLKNRYAVLRTQQVYKAIYSPPPLEEFLDLARSGYPLAYIDAAQYHNTFEETLNISILNEAAGQGYAPASMYIGALYEDQARLPKNKAIFSEFLEKSRHFYQEAGRKGVALSYIVLGISYGGDIILDKSASTKRKFNQLPEEIIEKTLSAFRKAGEAHHPRGWDYLAQAYSYLAEHAEEKARTSAVSAANECGNTEQINWNQKWDEYCAAAYDALVEGIKLGSQWAYHEVHYLYSDQQDVLRYLARRYGPAPQEKAFRDFIASFLAS